jgi:hypothetical protein
MNRIIPYSKDAPLPIVMRDKEMFFQNVITSIKSMTSDQLFNWLRADYNFCYLASWLHPQTAHVFLSQNAKALPMRSQHFYKNSVDTMSKIWNAQALSEAIITTYQCQLRHWSDFWFGNYCNKFDRDNFSINYIYYKLPFYFNDTLISNYNLKTTRTQENVTICFQPNKPLPQTCIKFKDLRKHRIYIPFGLFYAVEALDHYKLCEDIIRMCTLYVLKPNIEYLKYNEGNRILSWTV